MQRIVYLAFLPEILKRKHMIWNDFSERAKAQMFFDVHKILYIGIVNYINTIYRGQSLEIIVRDINQLRCFNKKEKFLLYERKTKNYE